MKKCGCASAWQFTPSTPSTAASPGWVEIIPLVPSLEQRVAALEARIAVLEAEHAKTHPAE